MEGMPRRVRPDRLTGGIPLQGSLFRLDGLRLTQVVRTDELHQPSNRLAPLVFVQLAESDVGGCGIQPTLCFATQSEIKLFHRRQCEGRRALKQRHQGS